MVLGDMEDDRACLEQGEIAFLIGWNLAERMKAQMRGFLHRTERNKANLVGLAHFFKRPANARITRQSLAAIGRPFKGGNDDGHREAPLGENHRLRGWQSCQGKLTEIEDDPFPCPVCPHSTPLQTQIPSDV